MMTRKYLMTPKLPLNLKNKYRRNFLFVLFLLLPFLPWISFTVGSGQVTALNPNERVQSITASVGGFIDNWHVKEGDTVKKGQLIVDLVDNDPSLLERLEKEKNAAKSALASAELMMKTAEIDLERQKNLFIQGLSSRKDYEKAKIEFSKLNVEFSKNITTMTRSETQLSRQSTQRIIAPRDGVITRILPGERGQLIKAGTPIAVFTPFVTKLAAEIWIDGNDVSMLVPGQNVQLQFEGWPSIQIPGWPSVAIGTFSGQVYLVDPASSHEGKVRVLVIPSSNWPTQHVLRLGVHTRGYIRLNDSFILKEIWRQLNGFPPLLDPIKDELNKVLTKKTDDFSDKDNLDIKK